MGRTSLVSGQAACFCSVLSAARFCYPNKVMWPSEAGSEVLFRKRRSETLLWILNLQIAVLKILLIMLCFSVMLLEYITISFPRPYDFGRRWRMWFWSMWKVVFPVSVGSFSCFIYFLAWLPFFYFFLAITTKLTVSCSSSNKKKSPWSP